MIKPHAGQAVMGDFTLSQTMQLRKARSNIQMRHETQGLSSQDILLWETMTAQAISRSFHVYIQAASVGCIE